MQNIQIDSTRALKRWGHILEEMGVTNPERKEWMSVYAEGHSLLETNSYANLANIRGMGAIRSAQPTVPPGSNVVPSGAYNGIDQYTGSGDIAANMIPVSMKIAAQTIGLDLVTVKTTTSPVFDLVYVDFQYSDGVLTQAGNNPQTFKINFGTNQTLITNTLNGAATLIGAQLTISGISSSIYVNITGPAASASPVNLTAAQSLGTSALPASSQGVLEFIGYSRIDNNPMFRTFRQTNAYNQAPVFNQALNTFASTEAVTDAISGSNGLSVASSLTGVTTVSFTTGVSIQLISALEDHLEGFSSAWAKNVPLTRDQAELDYPFMIEPNVFTRKIQVGDIQVGAALKRQHIEDIKASTGYDIIQKTEGILVNELSQKISREIVQEVKNLGILSRTTAPTITVYTGTATNTYSEFDYNVDDYLDMRSSQGGTLITPPGEQTHSLQRRLVAKIINASNYILFQGRVGQADYLVTSFKTASILKDIAGYNLNPVPGGSNMTSRGKQLYPAGQIDGITVYVDPNTQTDNSIYLGRKNAVDEPGLLFIPYLMAQSISIISEATFAPKMILRSRYAVARVGFFPEKSFMQIQVTDTHGVLI